MATTKKESISKENFIAFISSMTHDELNQLIAEKGKPPKMVCPMFFFDENGIRQE